MAAYKPRLRRVGTIRYREPNPAQSKGSYIYQFYRLNKGIIDKAYSGIGAATPYEHFKQEALDLIAEQPRQGIQWATRYQLGKSSFVEASGGNTSVNNILRILRRTGSMQTLARLAGYNKSSSVALENYNGWTYDALSKQFTYTPISPKTGRPLPNGQKVTVWIQQIGRYPIGVSILYLSSAIGYEEIRFTGERT